MNKSNDPVVSLNKLAYRYPSAMHDILQIDSLTIERGERIFIQGASGTGKTTLLALLAGILVAQKGELNILGQPLHSLSEAERDRFRANHIGFIFQLFNLIPYLSILENIELACRFSAKKRAAEPAALEGRLHELLEHLGLPKEKHDTPVAELSVGQQQRVAAARALLGKPALLIADEPTSALDWNNREKFIKTLFRECEQTDTTLVFVSHDESLAKLFGRTINLQSVNQAATPAASATGAVNS